MVWLYGMTFLNKLVLSLSSGSCSHHRCYRMVYLAGAQAKHTPQDVIVVVDDSCFAVGNIP